ncbi:MAG: hypothetical protein IPN13_16450 [Bacteroidetes bacterium]|nr:hypothetical protein [Bacteroidota bacterium]
MKHHDYEFWNTITKGNTITFDVATKNYDESDEFVPFRLRGVDKIDRDYVSGCLSFYSLNALQSTRTVHIQKYRDLNAQLLQLLGEAIMDWNRVKLVEAGNQNYI